MLKNLQNLELMLRSISEYRGAKAVSKIYKKAMVGGRITIPGDDHSTYEYIPFSEYSGEGGYFEVITSQNPTDVGFKIYPHEIDFHRILNKGVGQGVIRAKRDIVHTGLVQKVPPSPLQPEPEPVAESETSVAATPAPTPTSTSQVNEGQVYNAILAAVGAPATDDNIEFLSAWASLQPSVATNNPFNLTMRLPGSTSYNPGSVGGVQNYPDQETFIKAMEKTLVLRRNHAIVLALKSEKPSVEIASIPGVQDAVSNISGASKGVELYNKLAQINGVAPIAPTAAPSSPASNTGGKPNQLDEAGENFLKAKEGRELRAYPDPPGQTRNYSIGYGYSFFPNGFRGQPRRKVRSDDIITEPELEELFDLVSAEFEGYINEWVTSDINQNQYNALVALVYNIGPAFKNSNLLRMINENPNNPDIGAEFEVHTKGYPVGSSTYRGLLSRRKQEAQLYFQS